MIVRNEESWWLMIMLTVDHVQMRLAAVRMFFCESFLRLPRLALLLLVEQCLAEAAREDLKSSNYHQPGKCVPFRFRVMSRQHCARHFGHTLLDVKAGIRSEGTRLGPREI